MFADIYDANAEIHHAQADSLLYVHLARPLAAALAGLPGPVLDVAGGTGALGKLVGASVTLDISARQLRHHPAPHRIRGDAERLPFRSDSFGVAGCSFGINHFPDPVAAVREMARVAPVVGLLTWRRPDPRPYLPRVVLESLAQSGANPVARVAEELGIRTGSVDAVRGLLADAGLSPQVREVAVDVPWPGPERFVDYRLNLTLVPPKARDEVRRRAVAEIAALDPAALRWRPRLILGLGRRSSSVILTG